MTARNTVYAQPLASFNAVGLTVNFKAINVGGFTAPCFLVRVINSSNMDITISYDGVTPNDYVLSEEVLTLPTQSNAGPISQAAYIKEGTTIYVKAAGAGIGMIYLAAYYQPRM
jgi:hypothetical protein